jgi:hypothetical protein
MASVEPKVKTCVVCGFASHRTDWINKQGDYVACDSHAVGEFQRAVANAQAQSKSTVSTKPPATAPPVGQVTVVPTTKPAQGGETTPAPTADAQAKTAS